MYEITMLEGYGTPRAFTRSTSQSGQKDQQMKLAQAARQCKGRKKGAFRACMRAKLKKGGSKKRRSSRRRRR